MTEKLSAAERTAGLEELEGKGWTLVKGRDAVHKSFEFKNFVQAFGWMTQVAIWAEKLNHHPEWSNVYNTVEVTLSTHDVSGLTELDLKLARKMDSLATG